MTQGEIALVALAQLDILTTTSKWHSTPAIRRKIRRIINVAKMDIEKVDDRLQEIGPDDFSIHDVQPDY